MSAQLLRSSISSLVALQLFSRLFTFALNQALLRLVSPSAYGTAAIQFELMLNTILFLSREGVRNSLLRARKDKSGRSRSVENLSFLPILLGLPLALSTTILYGTLAGKAVKAQPYFIPSIWVYALAAIVELLAEPMHNTAMSELRTDIRVKAEGLGVTSKTLVTFLVIYYDSSQEHDGTLALLAFSIGQLSYSLCLVSKYVSVYGVQYLIPWRPSTLKEKDGTFWDSTLLRLSISMTVQSIVKHFLTEGDKLILSWFSPLQDQGGYAIAVNYGSLIARIVFQPMEESLRVFFSRTLPSSRQPKEEEVKAASRTLTSLISIQLSISLLLLAFAPPYLPLVLRVLLPPQYLNTSAPAILHVWVYYLPFLAINGGLEAFVSSVAKPADLARQSRYMALFSALYTAAAVTFYKFTSLGDASLVYANIMNLAARIAYCIVFTNIYYSTCHCTHLLPWPRVRPQTPFVLLTIVSAILVRQNKYLADVPISVGLTALLQMDIATHIAYGGLLAISCIGLWWKTYNT